MSTSIDIPKEIRTKGKLRPYLCSKAYLDARTFQPQLEIVECITCDDICTAGALYLDRLSVEELKELRCGGDCEECVAPCRVSELLRHKKQKRVVKFLRVALNAGSAIRKEG